MFHLLGSGKVGSALRNHFDKANVKIEPFDIIKTDKNSPGLLFLATPDSTIRELTKEISTTFKSLTIVHFSAAADNESLHLLHPYCSITSGTNLDEITFTLWTKEPQKIEKNLKGSGINFVYAGESPSPLYHASAVISGNFSQFLTLTALELLQNEGFNKDSALKLINQLMLSSLENIASGLKGISGPASRGDMDTVKIETEALKDSDAEISEIFEKINKMIKKAVENGTILRK